MYKKVLSIKRKEFNLNINRLKNGLEIIDNATIEVESLKITIQKNKPILVRQEKECDILEQKISKDLEEAEKVSAVIKVQEEKAEKSAAEQEKLVKTADEELAKTEPLLKKATECLKKLNTGDVAQVKNYQVPPEDVSLVLKLVCILMGDEPKDKSELINYFKHAKLSTVVFNQGVSSFLTSLFNYDKQANLTPKLIRRIEEIINK